MRVGIIGTGAIADKHAQAYRSLGFDLRACCNESAARGNDFAARWQCQFIPDYRELCRLPGLDFVDVCTYPNFRLEPVEACASIRRPVQLEKPMATTLPVGQQILQIAQVSGIKLSVISQHRFDDSTIFLKRALGAGRLGKVLQADAYVKWFRSPDYYARSIKGSWATEGGGALINQAIHQLDLLLYLFGPVSKIKGMWQLGARHGIESEDIVNALLRFDSGVTAVLQASTAFWPGYPERIEVQGTKGTAVISGDRLTTWDVLNDEEANSIDPVPLQNEVMTGASNPMAISLLSFERQFMNFARAIQDGTEPSSNAQAGYLALQTVMRIYDACKAD